MPTTPTSIPPNDLTVVIVNYNAGEFLARCLGSLPASLEGFDWRAIVVDNASVDGSERYALEASERVTLIPAGRNAGFAAAVNTAAAATGAPLLLLLNPDAEMRPGVVPSLIEELERDPECAVIGPGILNTDGTLQGSARRDPFWLTGLFGRSTLLTRLFPNSPMAHRSIIPPDLPPGTVSLRADWVSGACMLLRREAFDRCGGFDTGYFLYWEDADLCRRLRRLGYTIRYRPDVHVRHAVGGSSESARPLAIRAFHQSAARYYAHHVARSEPERWLARALLAMRCQWRLWWLR
jgi:N-acetylglucosaminyl-diphospho-decaprenol L-rhamnosyltransferase